MSETGRQKIRRFRDWSGWKLIDYYLVRISLVLCVLTGYLYFHEVQDRRNAINRAFCSIIRRLPPGFPPIDDARKNFQCGPYVPFTPSRPNKSPSPGTHTPSSSAHSSSRPAQAHTPPSLSRSPHPTRTVSITPPRATKTVTPSRTPTPSSSTTAPTTSPPSSPGSPQSSGLIASICNLPLIGGICSL